MSIHSSLSSGLFAAKLYVPVVVTISGREGSGVRWSGCVKMEIGGYRMELESMEVAYQNS